MSLGDFDVNDVELSASGTTVYVNNEHSWIKLENIVA
jgi:hypothetical protein